MCIRRFVTAVLASLLCAQGARAQSVRGIVVAHGDMPVAGVVVLLIDTTSTIMARALTNELGAYQLAAPRSGAYRLRTLRIGFTPVLSAPFVLHAGAPRTERVDLTELAFSLDTARVASTSTCRPTSPESLAEVLALWEQARTALYAAELTARGGTLDATTLRYARLFRRDLSSVVAQASEFRTAATESPWQAFSPETLHARGYVRTGADDSVTYAAPGLDALASDAFLDDHCFSLASKGDDEVRIAFEPSRERARLPEISGTVALSRATAELRRIEFHYVNLPPVQMAQAGGGVSFARLRDGGWIIPRWDVRMPVLGLFGGTARQPRELKVARVRVEGGDVITAVRHGDTLWRHAPLVLSGRVLDSASGTVVSGARVSVTGSKLTGETARDGTFHISGLMPGVYGLEVRGPGRTYAGMAMAIPLTFTDSADHVELRIPTATQVAGAVCQLEWLVTAVSGGAILTGRVDASLLPSPHAPVTVVADWDEKHGYIEQGGIRFETEARSFETLADSTGEFRICFIPTDTPIWVHATAADVRAPTTRVRVPPELHFGRIALTLDSNLEPVTSISAVVLGDSAGQAIVGAEIALPELHQFGTTDDRGMLRLSEVALGTHTLTVRRSGFAPFDTTIALEKQAPVKLRLVLRAQSAGATTRQWVPPRGTAAPRVPVLNESRAASRTPLPLLPRARETASRECSPPSAPPGARPAPAAAACAR